MNRSYTFSSVLITIIIALNISFPLNAQTESSLVYPANDGKLVYTPHANTQESNNENIVIDYSHCGFMQGGVTIPDVPVRVTVYPQFGDDQERIQEAIDYVSSLTPDENGYRGAVLLKAGTYELGKSLLPGDDALQIKKSGVVLRGDGQGSDGTILKSSFEEKHQIIATRVQRPQIGTTNTTKIIDPYVGSGNFGFNVDNASGFAVGDTIFVRFTPNQTWLDEIYANAYMSDGDLDWSTGTYTINYERIITNITGDSITIHSPVILPMQERFGGGEIVKLSFPTLRLGKIGVENMRLVGTGITPSCPADDPNRLQTAILFEYIENSWIRGITVLHTSNSLFKLWDSHYITVEDCASIEPLGPKRAGYRYTFYIDAASSHNLCQRIYSDDGRHDFVLGPRIPGPNVFLDGLSHRGGTQGPHQRWATGTLFDNLKMESLIALEHRGSSGSGHSWAGAQSTIWNTESPSVICDAPVGHMNYAIGNTGTEILSQYINNTREGVFRGYYDNHGSHVATRSLYLKQLEDRLGDSVENVTIPEQLQGTIYDILNSWRGKGKLTEHDIAQLQSPEELSLAGVESNEGSEFIELQWADNVPDETAFEIERSTDGGETFAPLASLAANTISYIDNDIQQDTYHYRIKSVNDLLESKYIYLYVDLFDEAFYGNIQFRVNMSEISDIHESGDVWFVDQISNKRYEMTDADSDSIYNLSSTFFIGKDILYNFAYQNGPDSATNIVIENISDDCADNNGYRNVTVTENDNLLDPILFGSCAVALPNGVDITDLPGTIITGSNEDEPWIDGDNGAGSPPGETIDKLIDNDVNTKYLVRAVSSWFEIKTNRYTRLTGYTITSANDDPSRDPRDWKLRVFDENTGRWNTIHSVADNPPWEERFKMSVWTFDNDEWYDKYRFNISDINGNAQGLMQMSELQLFGEVGDFTGTEETLSPIVTIYPMPACDYLNIKWEDRRDEMSVEIYDIAGKRLYTERHIPKEASTIRMDLSLYRPGLHILKIISGDQVLTKKVIFTD